MPVPLSIIEDAICPEEMLSVKEEGFNMVLVLNKENIIELAVEEGSM